MRQPVPERCILVIIRDELSCVFVEPVFRVLPLERSGCDIHGIVFETHNCLDQIRT